MSSPPVQYAQNGDVHIAYRVLGDGPLDLVLVAGALTNLDVLWEFRDYRRACERLSSFARLITFDKRGMGLSDRVRVGTLEERMDDVRAILDAVGSESAALLGISEGGPMSMLFAATYPERTRALVLCGAEVKEETTDDWPWGEATREEFEAAMDLDRVVERWGQGLVADFLVPSRKGDPQLRELFGRLQVQSATPHDAIAFMRMAFEIDVRHVAPLVQGADADHPPRRRPDLRGRQRALAGRAHRGRPVRRARQETTIFPGSTAKTRSSTRSRSS